MANIFQLHQRDLYTFIKESLSNQNNQDLGKMDHLKMRRLHNNLSGCRFDPITEKVKQKECHAEGCSSRPERISKKIIKNKKLKTKMADGNVDNEARL